jgi:hypothetical protein
MLDRLDRLVLLAGSAPRAGGTTSTPASSSALAGVPARLVVRPSEVDHITSKRGPKFVDYTTCPACQFTHVGLAYQGELMSGKKVHTLASHTVGAGCVVAGRPRCAGSGLGMALVGGGWVREGRP